MRTLALALFLIAPTAASADAADELSRLTLSRETWDAVMESSAAGAALQFSLAEIPESAAGAGKVRSQMERILPYAEILEFQAATLRKHYTESELKQLLAFYKTPLGQKVVRTMPAISNEVSQFTIKKMMERLPGMFGKGAE